MRIGYAVIAAVALAAGFIFSQMLLEPSPEVLSGQPSFSVATVIPEPRPLTPFELQDHRGRPFSSASLEGRWSFLVFGYTHCPDICPTALMTLSRMDERLKQQRVAADYQVVFVSIDPERDSRQRLAQYVPYFNSEFLGVRGEQAELTRLTTQLGVVYLKVQAGRAEGDYLMDHSAAIVLIDPQGRYHAVFSAPHKAEAIAEDFRRISS
ncbi:MAG: SCO family protein [Gammaproteobacteria bacterium]|nr:SCO family protein [Gammaproteobacteria bacterium]